MVQKLILDSARPEPEILARAARALSQGGVAALPTETLYGLAADIASNQGLEAVARIKGREADKPFPLIIGEMSQLADLVTDLPPLARELAERFWPGPLTLVLPAKPGLSPRVVSAQGGVGVRLSPHPVAAGLARSLGRAITATSANFAGAAAQAKVEDLDPDLLAKLDLVLDAGPCPGGKPSTILDLCGPEPRLLREGAIVGGTFFEKKDPPTPPSQKL
jgi:L-threonylcarbamoyladenylate synthase